jgi:hypothetical protein
MIGVVNRPVAANAPPTPIAALLTVHCPAKLVPSPTNV